MGKILAIDYGMKRTGIAITDGSKIFATGLTTVATNEIYVFLTHISVHKIYVDINFPFYS